MTDPAKVRSYDSQSDAYHDAFGVFLECTDQKVNARRWLDRLVETLPRRDVFIDAGAGNGQVTAWFTGKFERAIAIEPSPSLSADLRQNCPSAEVLPVGILDAAPDAPADLVLCSHVLYYLEGKVWLPTIARLASWLAPGGALVVILQNHETDCMRMLYAFRGQRFDLEPLACEFTAAHGQQFLVERELVESHVTTPDLPSAYTIAEFMLNLLPLPEPPARRALEDYVQAEFATPGGGYRFSCHQDFLVIRRRGRA